MFVEQMSTAGSSRNFFGQGYGYEYHSSVPVAHTLDVALAEVAGVVGHAAVDLAAAQGLDLLCYLSLMCFVGLGIQLYVYVCVSCV